MARGSSSSSVQLVRLILPYARSALHVIDVPMHHDAALLPAAVLIQQKAPGGCPGLIA